MYSRSIIIAVLSVLALASAKNNGNNKGGNSGGGNGMMTGNGNGNGNKNSVCKPYKTRKGAFGICISYCQAKKCHLKSEPTNKCIKMKAQFEKKTGETSLPCDPIETTPPTASPTTASPTPEPLTQGPTASPTPEVTSSVVPTVPVPPV